MQDLLTRLLLAGGGGFSPSALFGGGAVQGAWYDPSDTTTLFQNDAGTTPVTAVEQPVGLMLDKSKGLVLGSELVTNGDFSSGTGWTAESGITIGSGVASFATTSNQVLYQTVSVTAARFYRVTLTLVSYSSGTPGVSIGAGTIVDIPNTSVLGAKTMYVVAGSADSLLRIRGGTFGVGGTCSIDNISVRELPGNHAYQSTSASRPTLRARYNLLTYSEQFNDAAWSTTSGVTFVGNVASFAATTSYRYQSITVPDIIGRTYVARVKLSSPTGKATILFRMANGVTSADEAKQLVTLTTTPTVYTLTRTFTGSATTILIGLDNRVSLGGDGVAGDVVATEFQLVSSAVFPSNTYQRIAAATDYATGTAFPPYLFFDGTDDSMLTNSIDFATVTSDGQARRNLLLNPTQFDAAGWTKTDATVVANAGTAPDGTVTADLIYPTTTGTIRGAYQAFTASATTYTGSLYVKAAGKTAIRLVEFPGSLIAASVDLTTGAVSGVLAGYTVTTVDAQNGWWRVIYTASATAGTRYVQFMVTDNVSTSTATTNGTDGALFWGAQLETGSTATAFQNIGTDQMTVFAGVTKQSDAVQVINELSANSDQDVGSFYLANVSPSTLRHQVAGTPNAGARAYGETTLAILSTSVVTQQFNIAGTSVATEIAVRQNGVSQTLATPTGSAGTGNFGNYPLFIGRRNNTNFAFNGNLYSLIVQGATPTSSQLVSTEQWVAAKTPLGSV